MKTDELIEALGQLKVQTGSLACLGCGHEHNCGVHGCAIAREAAVRLNLHEHALKQGTKERDAAVKQLRRMADCAAWMAIRVLHVRPASVGNGTEVHE